MSLFLLLLLLGTHIYFTVKLKVIQRRIPEGIVAGFVEEEKGDGGISPYAALATALAATMGTGNIIGVSAAIAVGGPGAVFWCWLTGILGIATCYAECFLSAKYRIQKEDGTFVGGPMYVLDRVLHKDKLALFFSLLTVLASFGIGSSVQSHAIGAALQEAFQMPKHWLGIGVAMLAGSVVVGGSKKIAGVCTFLVPVMSVFYLGGCFVILGCNKGFVLPALSVMVKSAFVPQAVAGGVLGGGLQVALRVGVSKGLFTNEAGMGSIAMSAADAKTTSPVRQGIISMTGVFWDTVVMCAVTGMVIVSSILKNPLAFQHIENDRLCFAAFSCLPAGQWILMVSLVLFAFATIIGWSYYGECAAVYLLGEERKGWYQLLFILAVYLGVVLSLDTVWSIAEFLNMLMVIPNVISLFMLRKVIIEETLGEKK